MKKISSLAQNFKLSRILIATLFFISCNKESDEITTSKVDSLDSRVVLLKCGDQIGTYLGTPAYYNIEGVCTGDNTFNNYYTGKKWQCVEYVNRLYISYYGRKITEPRGNANTYYNNSNERNLDAFPNNGTIGPKTGDIICSNGGDYGHIGICNGVWKDSITVIQQNWKNEAVKKLNKVSNNVSGFSTSHPVKGWLRSRPNLQLNAFSISPNPLVYNSSTAGSLTIKNSSLSLNFSGSIYISLHDLSGIWKEDIKSISTSINAGSTFNISFSKTKLLSAKGSYKIHVKFQTNGAELKYPLVNNGTISNLIPIEIK